LLDPPLLLQFFNTLVERGFQVAIQFDTQSKFPFRIIYFPPKQPGKSASRGSLRKLWPDLMMNDEFESLFSRHSSPLVPLLFMAGESKLGGLNRYSEGTRR